MLSQNVSDGAARNLMAQIGQGALDPRVAPIPVLRGHSDHQPLDLVLEAGPAGASPLAAIILPSVSVRPYQVGPQRCSRRSAIGGCETPVGLDLVERRGVVASLTVLGGCGGGRPGTRQELVNTALGPARREFAQDVGEVSKWRDTMQGARPGEAIENCRTLRRTM